MSSFYVAMSYLTVHYRNTCVTKISFIASVTGTAVATGEVDTISKFAPIPIRCAFVDI